MVSKRYQVFISSTYTDLKEERQKVMQAVMEMDCIPAGMELFPAMDEEQLNFIKSVIDDSDYYVIVIGGRYGSLNAEGISYTEAEYDYAVLKGMKVIALLHGKPEQIPQGKAEDTDEGRRKLVAFRQKLSEGRLVRFWKQADELPGLVALSLAKTIKAYPAKGWVRGDTAANEEVLAQLNSVRTENEHLKIEVEALRNQLNPRVSNLANLADKFTINYKHKIYSRGQASKEKASAEMTWSEILGGIGPYYMKPEYPYRIGDSLTSYIQSKTDREQVSIEGIDLDTIKVHLIASNILKIETYRPPDGRVIETLVLTDLGYQKLLETKAVRREG